MLRQASGALLAALALFVLPERVSADPALPPGFQDEVVFDGLEQPTNFRFAEDGRVFVAEKPGRILVYEDLEDDSPEVFADLRSSVYDLGDRGLLGLELDPEFTEGRPYVYALYTWDHVLGEPWNPEAPKYGTPKTTGDPGCPTQNSSASCLVSGRLVRLAEDPLNPNTAIHESGLPKEEELVQGWCQQFSSHSVGDLEFGTEGALYVSGGDGAAFESIADYGQLGTPPNPCGDLPSPAGMTPDPVSAAQGGALRSQNLELLSGAILRLDPDTGAPFPGNPLAAHGSENARRTIAKGLRNPFRFAFDPQTGDIYSGNVGSSEIEEIDRFQPLSSLYNSGWPCFEGIERHWQFKVLGLDVCEAMYAGEPGSASLPFFTYSHGQSVVPGDECPTEAGSAVGGISFYGGDQFPPAYKGALFFADAVRGCIWAILPGEGGKPDPSTAFRFLREGRVYPGVKIAEGPDGYLYYASLFSKEGIDKGAIHRIAYRPKAPTARLRAEPPFGLYDPDGDFETTLDASGSVDPDSEPLTYEWDLEEDGTFVPGGSQKAVSFTKTEQEAREAADPPLSPNRVVAVRVEDDEGFTSIARVTVYPGDKPPQPTIVSPVPSFEWGVGDEIHLYAEAEDAEGNPITSPLPYYWETRMAHCPDPANPTACHVHPLQTFAGLRYAKFVAPQHEYPSYIEVVLRVSSERGLSGTASLELNPRTVDVSLDSNLPGVRLRAGSTEAPTPFSIPAIDGSEILLSAPPTTTFGGQALDFLGWSDGGDRERSIKVSAAQSSYAARYEDPMVPPPPEPPGPPTPRAPQSPEAPQPPAIRQPPGTLLGKHPPKRTRSTMARFTFGGGSGGAAFGCKLDARRVAPCRSPKIYKRLKPGRHTFRVWAIEGALVDPTPAKFSWKVLRPQRR